jgi:hypothetical protein
MSCRLGNVNPCSNIKDEGKHEPLNDILSTLNLPEAPNLHISLAPTAIPASEDLLFGFRFVFGFRMIRFGTDRFAFCSIASQGAMSV